jgi:hypothetical protein
MVRHGRTERLRHELVSYRHIEHWMARMRSFGHGVSRPISGEEALRTAAEATPAPLRESQPFAEDPPLGAAVRVRADDYGRDAVVGELVLIDSEEIALWRRDARVGEMVVHFPRLGYDLRAL